MKETAKLCTKCSIFQPKLWFTIFSPWRTNQNIKRREIIRRKLVHSSGQCKMNPALLQKFPTSNSWIVTSLWKTNSPVATNDNQQNARNLGITQSRIWNRIVSNKTRFFFLNCCCQRQNRRDSFYFFDQSSSLNALLLNFKTGKKVESFWKI